MLSFTRKRLVVVVVVFFCAVFALAAFSPVSRAWRVAKPAAESAAANEANAPDKGDSRQASKADPLVPDDFDCSTITEKGIDRQENLRAGAILAYCGWFPGAYVPGGESEEIEKDPWHFLTPFSYGGLDVNVSPGFNNAIQSETFVWGDGGNNIMTTYNDLSGGSTGKGARSTDGGTTWARLAGDPFGTGHGSNFGDPAVVYDALHSRWIVEFLASGCGGQGIGAWFSTDTGATWTTGGCVNAPGGSGDRNSAWQDNNPASPFYGRSYLSYNDFSVGGGALKTAFSTDGGVTFSTPATVFGSFRRDIQMTGDVLGSSGRVYVAAMDEGGGGAANRSNYMYRSTDGGVTWGTGVLQGPAFAPPGLINCSGNSYFRVITPQIRHMGWGQPAVGGPTNVVHYVYAQRGAGADEGDIMYVRSTDSGATWSTPLMLNTDAPGGTRAQWMPSISASPTGAVFVKWYDRRDTANNDYWIYGRASIDNGVTWQADQAVSDAVIPQPIVQTANCYMGDYDYHSSNGITNQGLVTWTDSRGAGSGGTQDVFFDKVPVAPVATPTPGITQTPTPTPTPIPTPTPSPTPCGTNYTQTTGTGAAIVPGTTFLTGSNCDDCSNPVTLPFTFRLYNQPFTTVNAVSNGNLQFSSADTAFTNTCLPYTAANFAILPHWDDMLLTGTNQGIYTSTSGTAPNRIFNIEWTGGYFSGGGTADFEVRLYETTNQIDFVYGVVTQTGTSATIGLQKDTGSVINQFSCNTSTLSTGFRVTYMPTTCGTPSPSPTVTPGTPSPTPSVSPSPGCTPVWTAGANFQPPAAVVRAAGVYFPANGRFYVMGGRTTDLAGSDLTTPFEYNPATNTWVAKTAVYPDNQVNNMACGVLTDAGTPYIYCVGGSAAGAAVATGRVFRYNPVTDAISAVAAPWPQGTANVLPGGFTIFQNKLYILGGFDIPGGIATSQIWEFTPTTNVWVQKAAVLPVPRGYIPTTTIGTLIFTGGGGSITGGVITDATDSFVYNPVGDSISTIASIPRATGETRAFNIGGKMWVLGGGRTPAPGPSNEVDVYDPGTGTWSLGPPFTTPRRNFPAGSDGSRIWITGGYTGAAPGTPTNLTEIFGAVGCPTPTPSATPSPSTPTPSPSCSPGGGPIIVNGDLATGDPTLATRLFRVDPPSTCAAPVPYPGTSGVGPFFYDTYTFPNTTGAPACITVNVNPLTCTGTPFIHSSAYLNTFDPANLATNYLGTWGASQLVPTDFSVTVPAGQSIVVVVNAVTAGTGGACAGYILTITGLGGGGGCATPTPGITPTPTPTPSASPSPACTPNYNFTVGTGTMIPATTRIDGVGCDDCTTSIPALPFPVSIYGTSYSAATVGSNGILAFGTNNNAFGGSCIPVPTATNQLMPFYRDMRTDNVGGCVGCGIFTATTGTAPNRVFTIEYKTIYFGETSATPRLDFEVNLYESGATAFDYTYGLINATTQAARITSIGVQSNATLFRQFACDTTGLTPPVTTGQRLSWAFGACGTPSPSPTVTPPVTPTPGTPSPSPSCTPSGGVPGPWGAGTTGPPVRYRAGGTTDGTFVYVFGGGTATATLLNDLWRWDPATGTWTQLANMPTGKQNIQGAYWNGKIYVPGGFTTVHLTENAIYDIATNTWSTGAPLPAAQTGTNVAFNNKVYNFGGNPGPQTTVTIYDIPTNTWSAGAPMPVATTYGRAVASGGFAYYVGGIAAATTNAVFRYSFAGNTWTTMAPLQTARTSEELMASPDGTSLFAVMGGDATFFTGVPLAQSVEIYNIAANTWTFGNPVVTKAAAPSGGLAGGKLMVEGGVDGTTYLNNVQVSTLTGGSVCATPSPSPTATPTTPTPTPSASPTVSPAGTTMQFSMGVYPGDESQVEPVTITRTGIVTATSSVNFSATNGTATGGAACTAGVDFLTILNQVVQFNPGETSKVVFITTCGDTLVEPTETINLTLSNPTGGTLGTPNTAIMNINDTANQFRNCTEIDFNLGTPAVPYPSTITVSGGPIQIGSIRVTLYDVTHQFPDNMDFLLVGPTGIKYIFMADSGGPTALTTPATLTFSDNAASAIPNNGPLVTGSFKPVSWEAPQTSFAPPAPPAPYIEPGPTGAPTLRSAFGFTNANGDWNLYARDDNGAFNPEVLSGVVSCWGLEFLQTTAAGVSLSGRVTTASGAGIRNARVIISGNSLPEARTVTTGSFGYFSFEGLTAGETYVVTVNSQRYTFQVPSRVITLVDNLTDVDFTAEPNESR